MYEHFREIEDRHWWFRGRRAVISALIGQAALPDSPRILDGGCGTGGNLRDFGELGEAHGVDPSPIAIEACRRRGLEVHQAGLERLPFAAESFDLMLACDVIEHIENDISALAELRRVARSGATLVITVPAYKWLWSLHDEAHHHFRRYTKGEILERLATAGWTPTFASHFNSTLLAPIVLVRQAQRIVAPRRTDWELTPKWLDRALSAPMYAEARLMRRGISLPAGISIGVTCVLTDELPKANRNGRPTARGREALPRHAQSESR